MRWCDELTKGMSVEDALGAIRSLVPDSLIGDHASSHWETYCTFSRGRQKKRLGKKEQRQRIVRSFYDRARHRFVQALERDMTLHKRLNDEIKRRTPMFEPMRLFAGAHDVDAFLTHAILGGSWENATNLRNRWPLEIKEGYALAACLGQAEE